VTDAVFQHPALEATSRSLALATSLGGDSTSARLSTLKSPTTSGVLGKVGLTSRSAALHATPATVGGSTTTIEVSVAAAIRVGTGSTLFDEDLFSADGVGVGSNGSSIAGGISKFDKGTILCFVSRP